MLKEEFETWSIDHLPNTTLIIFGIHITNVGYLEDRCPYFIELSDGNIEESNKILIELDTTAIILKTND